MNKFNKYFFWAGIFSIPLSVLIWFLGKDFNGSFTLLSDPGIRSAFNRIHCDLWAVFIGLWPANLLLLSKYWKE